MKIELPASVGLGLGVALVAVIVAGGAGWWFYHNRKLFDPTQAGNLADSGANSVVAALTGDRNQTVGGWFFDIFNSSAGLAPGETSVNGIITSAPIDMPRIN